MGIKCIMFPRDAISWERMRVQGVWGHKLNPPQQLLEAVLVGGKFLLKIEPPALTLVPGQAITSVCADLGDLS
jgi:hypothetical protein